MAILRSLLVTVGMKDDDFRKGVGRVKKDLQSMGSQIAGVTKNVALVGAGLGAAAAAGLVALTKHSMEAIDATGKLSDRLGINTEDLIGLQHAADLSGVSIEQLTSGLEKFIKTLPSGANVGDEFQKIATQIKATSDPVERAHIAMKAFGKSGQQLLPLLTGDLKSAQMEAENLGLSLTRGQAALVESANDSVTSVGKMFTGLGNTIAVAVSPFIDAAAKSLLDMSDNGKIMRDQVGGGLEFVVSALGKMGDVVNFIRKLWYDLTGSINAAIGAIAEAVASVLDTVKLASNLPGISGVVGKSANLIDTDAIRSFAKESAKASDEAFASADKAFGAFQNNTFSQDIMQAFKDIQLEAANTAKEINDNLKLTPTIDSIQIPEEQFAFPVVPMIKDSDADKTGMDLAHRAAFSQVDLSRIAVGGQAKGENFNPQIDTTNKILNGILASVRGGTTARYA